MLWHNYWVMDAQNYIQSLGFENQCAAVDMGRLTIGDCGLIPTLGTSMMCCAIREG